MSQVIALLRIRSQNSTVACGQASIHNPTKVDNPPMVEARHDKSSDPNMMETGMDIKVTRDLTGKMRHIVQCAIMRFRSMSPKPNGGEDSGPTPHDFYDSALAACKALTVLWYANRKQIPVEDIEVTVERDDSEERNGTYRLRTMLALTGPLRCTT